MAAHIVAEFPVSDCRTVFTGTSEEDTANLKIFWKSIHLNPTIESRLVSSDVRQRLQHAPAKSHEKHKFKLREEDPPQLAEFHKNVFRLESEDQHNKRMALLDRRADDLGRHKQRKNKREKVQKASSQRPISAEPYQVLPPITPEYNDDIDLEQERVLELEDAMNDLDNFDESHQLTYRVQGKEPVDEHAIKFD